MGTAPNISVPGWTRQTNRFVWTGISQEVSFSATEGNQDIEVQQIEFTFQFLANFSGSGTENDPYIIASTSDWDQLASSVSSGANYAGKYFRQTENISVTTMVGNSSYKFSGTYDGAGHTLTLTTSAGGDFKAPFRYAQNATFMNLRTAGTINTVDKYAAGFVGRSEGAITFINCRSSVTINSTRNGDGTNGGFMGILENTPGYNVTFEGCVFDGQMQGATTTCWGGFVGWSQNQNGIRVILTNSLFAPSVLNIDNSVDDYGSATFVRGGNENPIFSSITNSYYTEPVRYEQAKRAYSITAEAGLTVANAGTVTTYNVSGITSYGTGILYGGVLYGGEDEEVSLNISGSSDYMASAGTLAGSANPYTLTMAAENTSIYGALTLTANPDPNNPGTYYSTFYHSAVAYTLSAGVEAYVATISGDALILTKIAEGGQVIPKDNAVIFKANSGSITLTPSDATPVSFEATNILRGVDAPTLVSDVVTSGTCYILSSGSNGVGFYTYAASNTLKAHKAYAVVSNSSGAPKKLRFVFEEEQTATGVETVTGNPSPSTEKVIRNGQLIIIRNGVEYSADGKIVK